MEASTTTRLSDIVAALDAHIRDIRKLGLKQPALLLEMAKLDLQMRIHDISDVELNALCKAMERQEDAPQSAPPAPLGAENATRSTVVSLFGGGRLPGGRRPSPEKPLMETSSRAERRVRGKTLVPR